MKAFPHPAPEINRNTLNCPNCKTGINNAATGGRKTCFHCDSCEYIECVNCNCEAQQFCQNPNL